MCELALTKAQSEKRKVKSESAKRKRVLTPLLRHSCKSRCTSVERTSRKPDVSKTCSLRHLPPELNLSLFLENTECHHAATALIIFAMLITGWEGWTYSELISLIIRKITKTSVLQ